MIFRLITVVVVATFFMGCSKNDAKWIEVGYTPEMHFYIEKRVEMGSKVGSPFLGLKMLWDFNSPQTRPEGDIYKSVVLKLLIDCNNFKAADFEYTNYSGQMTTGSIVSSGERNLKVAEQELKEIKHPATKAVAEMACKRFGK
jgi:hypothetical protein